MADVVQWRAEEPLEVGGLEAMVLGPPPGEARTLVVLHGGLEGLETEFCAAACRATGWGVLAWSRAGFGRSEPPARPRGLASLQFEALEGVPQVLDAFGVREAVLYGHGEGAILAALYAGSTPDHRVRGLVLEGPRFFLEPSAREAVERASYEDLRESLEAVHRHPREVFDGWRRTWLDPEAGSWNLEEVIDYLRIPVLAIQGRDDPYGTAAHLEALDARSYCPVDFAVLEAGAAPHRERPAETLAALADFTSRLERIEEAGPE